PLTRRSARSTGTLPGSSASSNGATSQARPDPNANPADQIATAGAINLANPTQGAFNLNVLNNTAPANSTVFTFIKNTSGAITNPPLANAPENGSVPINGKSAVDTYHGGASTNDFTLSVAGPASFTDNTGNSQLTLQRVTGGGVDNIQLLRNGTVIDSRPTAIVDSYTITDKAGNDTLTVNYDASGGFFNLPVTFHGDPANGVTDTLKVTGGSFARATETFTTTAPQHSGNIVYDVTGNGTNTDTLNYDGLKPVLMNNGTINDIIFNLPAGTVQATLQDDGTANNNTSRIVSPNNAFETTTFVDPTNSLTINAGGGTDTINTSDANNNVPFSGDFKAALTINGTAATDTVNLN